MIRCIQINVGTARESHDLLYATATQKNADILLVSEQYKRDSRQKFEDISQRAAIINFSRLPVDMEGKAENGFVWTKIRKICLYSCYWSPNSTTNEFTDFIDRLQNSIRTQTGEVIVTGDFNAKHAAWGSPINDIRGELLLDMINASGMVVCNNGYAPTFERGGSASYIDITIATERTAAAITNWKVSSENSLSLHNYIIFDIAGTQQENVTKSGWNTRTLDRNKAQEQIGKMQTTFLQADGAEESVQGMAMALKDICDGSMKKCVASRRKTVHWWTNEIAELRKTSNHLRRNYQRKRRRNGEDACEQERALAKRSKRELVLAIKRSKERCWKALCDRVEQDPWGLPYRLVMGKLFKNTQIPEIETPGRIDSIIKGLFPDHPPRPQIEWNIEAEYTEITKDELITAVTALANNKAPGPDGVPAEILKEIVRRKPEVLLQVFNKCLKQGTFPSLWKLSRLVLLRKGDKPLENPSSYRPICMLNTTGKLLEKIINNRLRKHLEDTNGYTTTQYGFRKGLSTADALNRLKDIVEAKSRKNYTAMLTLDIRNAFNSTPWASILEAMIKKGICPHLSRIIDNYLTDRKLSYSADGTEKITTLTSGVPQGSVLGPTMWNMIYDGLLREEMPIGVETIAYADDFALIATAKSIEQIEGLLEEAAGIALRWTREIGLMVATEKSELIVFTNRRVRNIATVMVEGIEIESKKSMKYLGVHLDPKLNFIGHAKIVANKAAITARKLGKIMPNIGASKSRKRKLLATVVMSQMLYGAQVWAERMGRSGWSLLGKSQRHIMKRVTSAYRTVSDEALYVLAGMPPIELQARGRQNIYKKRKEGQNVEEIKEATKIELQSKWQERWQRGEKGQHTRRLIPDIRRWINRRHGEVNYHVTQALTGHGCFAAYLYKYGKLQSPECWFCGDGFDDASHTLFVCDGFEQNRRALRLKTNTDDINTSNFIGVMLRTKETWKAVTDFITEVMKKKEKEERRRQAQLIT